MANRTIGILGLGIFGPKLVAVDLTSFTKTTMLNLAMSIFLPTFVHAMVKMLSTRPFLERQGRILIFTIFGPNILKSACGLAIMLEKMI